MSIYVNGVKSDDLNDEERKAFENAKALKSRHVPRGTDGVVWAHGLNAVNRSQSPAVALEKLLTILGTGAEISCSKPGPESRLMNGGLGVIGVYVKGETSLMASVDCGSYTIDGKRYPSIREEFIVDDYEKLDDEYSAYTEAFVAPQKIVGFWISKKAYENYVTNFESGEAEKVYKKRYGENWKVFFRFEYLKPREGFISCFNMLKDMGIPMTFAY